MDIEEAIIGGEVTIEKCKARGKIQLEGLPCPDD